MAADSLLILLVDDYPDNRDIYVQFLTYSGLRVEEAENGHQALDKAFALHPDVIVAHGHDVSALQRAAWPSGVAFVTVTDDMRDPEALVEAIRRAIRETTTLRRA